MAEHAFVYLINNYVRVDNNADVTSDAYLIKIKM